MHSIQEPQRPDHAEVAFPPPLLLILALVLGFSARSFAPLTFLSPSLSSSIGPLLTAASIGGFLCAVRTMRKGHASLPTNEPTDAIITQGPYRFSRNPIYLATLLLQVGIGIWVNSLWFLGLGIVSALLLWRGVVSREERYLERKFGEEYLSYKGRVRRWL